MTDEVIVNHWMTIGTDNKANNIFTKSGRVKAGAKGIGRFALDKLGNKCKMITKPNSKKTSYVWYVNWQDFEGEFKTIDSINAKLYEYETISLKECIKKNISNDDILNIIDHYDFEHGTILHITNLRDNWDDYFVEQVYNDLEVLVPPKDQSSFKLYLFSEEEPKKYGEILGSVCDDYDYKVIASADKNQKVKIQIYRNEYDVDLIPPEFFQRKNLQKYPYRKIDFQRKRWVVCRTFNELLPGFANEDKDNTFEKIGKFKFTFYYMKRTYSNPDLEKFYYQKFNAKDRQDWLNKFGGIKLFRDDFRVRPYGEIKDSAFDWLGLGSRKTQNPAYPSHKSGKWKVEPDNIAGTIKISRIENINFEDKSSREGVQENKSFQIFKKILTEIMQIFESDRSFIAREMWEYYEEIHKDIISEKEIKKITDKIIKESEANNTKEQKKEYREKIILATTVQKKDEQIKQLEDEQKILRGMATSGIVTASFTHELSNLSDVLSGRIDELKELLEEKISQNDYNDTPDFLNPYILLEDMKKQDTKLQNWLKFSLESAKKDRRKRKKILLEKYFENLHQTWNNVFSNRKIQFNFNIKENDIDMRALEIDLDSIFNNLIVNSIDSFMRQKNNSTRKIFINIYTSSKEIIIDYYDNGEGLSKDIKEHIKIFDALYTTKRNEHTGEEIGTGLGMWLVDTIVREYDGKIKLLYPENSGFGIRIIFIRKFLKKEKNNG
jgi:signal transduction histidine kinase